MTYTDLLPGLAIGTVIAAPLAVWGFVSVRGLVRKIDQHDDIPPRSVCLGQGTRHDPRTFGDHGGLPVAGKAANQPVGDRSNRFHTRNSGLL